jgi:penicillin-binding protein 2
MFSSTNEIRGTSYRSRIDDPKYQFAGKTGTAQVKRISKRERELDLKIEQIPIMIEIMLYMLLMVHIKIQDML